MAAWLWPAAILAFSGLALARNKDGDAAIAATNAMVSNLIYNSIQILNAKHPDSTAAPG